MGVLARVLHALSGSTGEEEQVKSTANAVWVCLKSLLAGEDQVLGALGTFNATTEWVEFAGVTTGIDITISASAGDLLESITIYNGSASAITAILIKDNAVALPWLVPAQIAAGASATIKDGLGLRSKGGGWKINLTCAGTMSLIKGAAKGLFQA